jgi:hypothetical protein
LGLDDVSEKPSFVFTVPARNPRTLCCCQSVACIISAMLAPLGWLNSVSTRSCLVTRSTCGWSIFTGVLAAATNVLAHLFDADALTGEDDDRNFGGRCARRTQRSRPLRDPLYISVAGNRRRRGLIPSAFAFKTKRSG